LKAKIYFVQNQLKCPKCNGTTFERFTVVAKNLWSSTQAILTKSKDLSFIYEKCTNCGWQTHILNSKHIKATIDNMLMIASIPDESVRTTLLKKTGLLEFSFKTVKNTKKIIPDITSNTESKGGI